MDAIDAGDWCSDALERSRARDPRAPRSASPSAGWPDRNHPIRGAVMQRIDDPAWAVRQQLAASLGALEAGELRDGAITTILERHADRPGSAGRRPQRRAWQRAGRAGKGRSLEPGPDARARRRDRHAVGNDRARSTGRRGAGGVRTRRRRIAAVVAAGCRPAWSGGGPARCGDAGTARRRTRGRARTGDAVAVPDLSRRPCGSRRRLRVSASRRMADGWRTGYGTGAATGSGA